MMIDKIILFLKKPQNTFIIISGSIGLLLVFLVPPLQNPDENVHIYRAYQISRGELISPLIDSKTGGYIPQSLLRVMPEVNSGIGGQQVIRGGKVDREKIKELQKINLNESETKAEWFPTSGIYSPISYLIYMPGIIAARLFDMSPIAMIYLARISGLMCFIVAVFMLIRTIPVGKIAIAGIALLPMVLYQSAAITADTTLNIAVLSLVTFIVFYRNKKTPLSVKSISLLAIILLAIILSKQIFFMTALLLLLIPEVYFKNKKVKVAILGFLGIISVGVYLCWMILSHNSSTDIASAAQGANVSAQLNFMFSHPLGFIKAIANTYLTNYSDGIFISLAGTFGWLSIPLPIPGVLLVYFTLLLLLTMNEGKLNNKQPCNMYHNLMVWFVIISLALLITTALYLVFSPVGASYVSGIQGRYFLPLIIILYVSLQVLRKTNLIKLKNPLLAIASLSMLNGMWMIATVIKGFYG